MASKRRLRPRQIREDIGHWRALELGGDIRDERIISRARALDVGTKALDGGELLREAN